MAGQYRHLAASTFQIIYLWKQRDLMLHNIQYLERRFDCGHKAINNI